MTTGIRQRFQGRWADYLLLIVIAVVFFVAAATSDAFLTQRNLTNLFRQIVSNGLISLGMLVVILTGGVDLSVGPIVALSSILVAGLQNTIPLPLAVLIALLAGMSAG